MTNRAGPVLVIGATGQQGGAAARALLDRGRPSAPWCGMKPKPAARLLREAGAGLVTGDLDNLGSVRATMRSVSGVEPGAVCLTRPSARRRLKVGAAEILMEGVAFGESPRWHDGRLWFSDWGANQVIALGSDGSDEVVVTVASFPMCIDFLPDGRLLVVDSAQRLLLRREPDGGLVTHADLSGASAKPWNDIVVDDRATPTSIPSASTSPAASSRRASSCSPHRVADQRPTGTWFAIGGVILGRLDDTLAAGASGVVVVRATTEAEDPAATTRAFAEKLAAVSPGRRGTRSGSAPVATTRRG
jgi:hypothetical protein